MSLPAKRRKILNEGVSVFIGNLPNNTNRDKTLQLFSKFGKVKDVRFRLNNGSTIFNSKLKLKSPNIITFVDYASVEDAKTSLVLNGEKIEGNTIRVNLQRSVKDGDCFNETQTIFVGNLKYSITDENLHDFFSGCGRIDYVRPLQCYKGCKGIAYVCFETMESVEKALELNDSNLKGRPVRVQRYVKNYNKLNSRLQNPLIESDKIQLSPINVEHTLPNKTFIEKTESIPLKTNAIGDVNY